MTSSQMGNGGSGGAGAAGHLLTQGSTTSNEHTYGGAGNTGWNFDQVDGAADGLLSNMDDDADSTKAEHDPNNDSGFEDDMDISGYEDDSTVFHIESTEMTDLPELEAPHQPPADPPTHDVHLGDASEETVSGWAAPPSSQQQHGKMD